MNGTGNPEQVMAGPRPVQAFTYTKRDFLRDKIARYAWGVRALQHYGIPDTIIYFMGGIGDHLNCTVVARELKRHGCEGSIWMCSDHPGLFEHNPDIDRVVPDDIRFVRYTEILQKTAITPEYSPFIEKEQRTRPPDGHILSLMCRTSGITGDVTLRPYVYLTDAEKAAGKLSARQVAIQSSGMAAKYTITEKQWYPERFQEVVDRLQGTFDFIQLGSSSDPPLQGAADLRGKTTVRETAAIVSQSRAFVGQIGFLMHLARAVDCPGVIVYGGRELPSQSGYSANENLYTPLPCSPCWKVESCHLGRACMDGITAADVCAAIERQAERFGAPLPVDTDVVPGPPVKGHRPKGFYWDQKSPAR